MIKKGEYNLYDNTTKAIQAHRGIVKRFHELTGDKLIYLAIDYDLGNDFIFGEDTFPSVVAIYHDVCIRTEDGKPLNLSRIVNPFGYQLANSKGVYLNMDHFFEKTLEANNEIEYLKGKNWIPRNSDIMIDVVANKIYKINSVDEDEGEQKAKDRSDWKIVLVPHTIKNINTMVADGDEELQKHEQILESLRGVFGTTAIDNLTQEEEKIDQLSKVDDVKHDVYEIDGNGDVIISKARQEILGEF